MRVEVHFHTNAKLGVAAWLARLSRAPPGSYEMATFHIQELIRLFEASKGVPSGAVQEPSPFSRLYGWRFSSDAWVRFEVRDSRRSMWGVVREVIILEVAAHPPA